MEKYSKLLDRNFNEFKGRVYEKGILKLKLSSWDQFNIITKIFLNNEADYFWRGHQDESWELKSLFDREISKKSSKDVLLPHISKRQDKLNEILKIFDQKLKEILPENANIIDDDEKWAIGQHYGLPTPLLDWTVSPHIAAFIAFRKKCKKNQSENRVVYALSISLQRLINKNKLKLKNHKAGMVISSNTTSIDRFVDFLDLTNTCDDMQNIRLKAQQGRFTKALNGIDIKTRVMTRTAGFL